MKTNNWWEILVLAIVGLPIGALVIAGVTGIITVILVAIITFMLVGILGGLTVFLWRAINTIIKNSQKKTALFNENKHGKF